MSGGQTERIDIYSLVEELLFCWFRYHLPRGKRKQLINLLAVIKAAESGILFPIRETNYMVSYKPSSANSAILCIRRKSCSKIPDKRLGFMKSVLDQAKLKPENIHLNSVSAALTPDSLTFTISLTK